MASSTSTKGPSPDAGAGNALPIVFLDIDDVLCLNDPYGGSDALDAVE